MTVKDSVAPVDPRSGAARPGRRADAVGAEIPVTVHASRSTQGLGKNLPPVHEETRTVIVLQQGAVVRLTAALNTGETVVLTNRVTGADVLCRVGNVKSQPGSQHYVDLEFIQRAPGFWGDAVAVPLATPSEAAAAPPAMPLPVAPPPLAVMPPAAIAPPPLVPVAPTPVAPPISAAPVYAAAPSPVASFPVAAPPLQPAPLAEAVSVPWNAGQSNSVATIRPPVPVPSSVEPGFGEIGGLESGYAAPAGGSQKKLMAAAAAVLLVLGGAAGGYWFTRRGNTAPVSAAPLQQQTQQAAAISAPPLSADGAVPAVSSVPAIQPAPVSMNTPAPQPQADIFVDSRPPVESVVKPAPSAPARVLTPAVRRSNLAVGAIKAPTLKNTPVRADGNEPPPMMVAATNLGDTGSNALLGSASVGPAPPPAGTPRPAVGGQLQPPQLITSTAPVYPPVARSQNLQGVVILDAHIDETGKVISTEVIAGPAPLVPAAQDAVRNWKYQPARLNGKPIAINTKVSVRFSLQ